MNSENWVSQYLMSYLHTTSTIHVVMILETRWLHDTRSRHNLIPQQSCLALSICWLIHLWCKSLWHRDLVKSRRWFWCFSIIWWWLWRWRNASAVDILQLVSLIEIWRNQLCFLARFLKTTTGVSEILPMKMWMVLGVDFRSLCIRTFVNVRTAVAAPFAF